jgi:hypothetical protein
MNSGQIKAGDLVSFRVAKMTQLKFDDVYNTQDSDFRIPRTEERIVARRVIKIANGCVYVRFQNTLHAMSESSVRRVY